MLAPPELAARIDHTLLRPDATLDDILRLCDEAVEHEFATVCIQPCWVAVASTRVGPSGPVVCAVAGFPHGANTLDVKRHEARYAAEEGAGEIDMVIHVGDVKSGFWGRVRDDIVGIVRAAAQNDAIVKVILECCSLTDDEKRQAAEIAVEAGAAFVKTSTGYGAHGATVEDVRLLRETVGERCRVKAAGGIRTLDSALAMIEAGADRIGASAGIAILNEAWRRQGEAQ
jgi:deoxyribose-phosphate aldolase